VIPFEVEMVWSARQVGVQFHEGRDRTVVHLPAGAEQADPAAGGLPAGPLRRFWLATEERDVAPQVVAEAETAEETFEAVASGLGVTLLAAGNAEIYRRDDVVYRPVTGLSPSELAVIWRTNDDRKAIQVFVDACFQCLCTEPERPASRSGA
jgi:DNA-binding transcriptional LysR family regulator